MDCLFIHEQIPFILFVFGALLSNCSFGAAIYETLMVIFLFLCKYIFFFFLLLLLTCFFFSGTITQVFDLKDD